jgi:hypothetical protein
MWEGEKLREQLFGIINITAVAKLYMVFDTLIMFYMYRSYFYFFPHVIVQLSFVCRSTPVRLR